MANLGKGIVEVIFVGEMLNRIEHLKKMINILRYFVKSFPNSINT